MGQGRSRCIRRYDQGGHPAWCSIERRKCEPPVSPDAAGFSAHRPVAANAAVPVARPRLTFIGTGYLGATYAICFAELGYEVLGVDVDADEDRQARQRRGAHSTSPGWTRSCAVTSPLVGCVSPPTIAEAAAFGDVHFICVGTPQRADGMGADLSYVETRGHVTRAASDSQSRSSSASRPCRSARPTGSSSSSASTPRPELGVEVAWSPEFLQEGFAVEDVLRPNRLVLGVKSPWAHSMLLAAHKGVFDLAADRGPRGAGRGRPTSPRPSWSSTPPTRSWPPRSRSSTPWPRCARHPGADVSQLARAIGYDDRIGKKFLRAGVGFGGACLPKDIRAFQARAQELGAGEALRFLHEVDLINQRRRTARGAARGRTARPAVRPGRPGPDRLPDRGARRHVQTGHRRRPGLARAVDHP